MTALGLQPLVLARLLAGRGAFRLSTQAMAVLLAVVWGAERYGGYANALGVCAWLVFVPTAAEKAALKIVPRTRLLRAELARLALRVAGVPAVALLACLVVVALVAPGSPAELYAATAVWSVGTGLLMAVSGLHRLRGRPGLDAASFGAATAVVVVVTALTWAAGLSPATHALLLVAGLFPVVVTAVAALPGDWRRGRARRALLPAFGRSTALLGVTEVIDAVAVSAMFLLLAATGRTTDSGPFYLALLASGMVCSFALYAFKLGQPATSARLRGPGAAAGRARADRLLRGAELVGGAAVVLAGLALLSPAAREAAGGLPVLCALVAFETAMCVVVLYAAFLLENTTGAVLTRTAAAAVFRLAVVLVAGAALVPAFGAAGGVGALVLSFTAQAALLRRLVRRHRPVPTPDPAPRLSAR